MTLPELNRSELLRYARHLALPQVGLEGQRRLKSARVLCVGAGGLGSPLALYLAAAGVGTLGLVDFDVVDITNLQRQLLHGTRDVDRPKLDSAADRLADVNPHVHVVRHEARLTSENALAILADYDVVVDGTDNFPTRYLVNDACVMLGKPNVYGSVFRWEGQASVFSTPGAPCYRCLFREPPPPGLVPNCAEGGVLGVLPGIIGSLQAMETVKLLLGVGETLAGRLLIFDALEMSWREVRLRRNPDCPVCGDEPTQTGLIDYEVFCGMMPAPGEEAGRPVPELDALETRTRLVAENPPFLLDVREPWEWSLGNLEALGARLIPLGDLSRRRQEVPRDRPVVVYCRSGQRSETAARQLLEDGYPEVYNLQGGALAWARDVDPDLVVV
ncbi:MAG: molybdopterin-synthase adenylyltransferase MoeB [Gemmatimonadota bacterium]|jgi:molybdopterin/thiamine biosynthesis adenylyltransferase/rhodanese-related sulfurtransferase